MKLIVEKSQLRGAVEIPASKSHSVRAAVFATLAEGESTVRSPLDSLDTQAAVGACQALGAEFAITPGGDWRVKGAGGKLAAPENVIDVMNSGTTLYIVMSTAALIHGWTVLTGDASIRRRPADRLLKCLNDLGAEAFSTRGNDCCPLVIQGPLKGGRTSLEAITSQWLTSLLINCPLAQGGSNIDVPLLNEAPYVRMTLDWLDYLGIRYEHDEAMKRFHIPGRQSYKAFERRVPGDFSTATFFLAAGAALDAEIELRGLDMEDSQGDKAVVDYVQQFGAAVNVKPEAGSIAVKRAELRGCELDLNATPDALPAMAVAAALAEGETRLLNVPQARVKETDRLAVMNAELTKMGARIEELEDGLIVQGGSLRGAKLNGHHDHRVVMSLALAGMAAEGRTEIDTAESVAVTFPGFVEKMQALGARIQLSE
ncbi:3-phosphoshikimate 1-carboxyvinyltransferase [Candidatus Sumerlaeota bacterium]|nr:3-phosphoshikimate 1-carboxyvinyltransferase [Candidatus Sumerlaeota bacterium]